MKQQAIKVLSPEHGYRAVEYFKGKGGRIPAFYTVEDVVHRIKSGGGDYIMNFDNWIQLTYKDCLPDGIEIITLPEETVDIPIGELDDRERIFTPEERNMTVHEFYESKQSPYPKMMMVWDDGFHIKNKALVINYINGYYVASEEVNSFEDINSQTQFLTFENAEDIPETREEKFLSRLKVLEKNYHYSAGEHTVRYKDVEKLVRELAKIEG